MKHLLVLIAVLTLCGCGGSREMLNFAQEPNLLAIVHDEQSDHTIRNMRSLYGDPQLTHENHVAYIAKYGVFFRGWLFDDLDNRLEIYYLVIDESTWTSSVYVDEFSKGQTADAKLRDLLRKSIPDITRNAQRLSRQDLDKRYESMPENHRY